MIGVYLMGAPPDGWLDTIPIGRSPSYFRFNNRLCSIIAVSWECQLKTVVKITRICKTLLARYDHYLLVFIHFCILVKQPRGWLHTLGVIELHSSLARH